MGSINEAIQQRRDDAAKSRIARVSYLSFRIYSRPYRSCTSLISSTPAESDLRQSQSSPSEKHTSHRMQQCQRPEKLHPPYCPPHTLARLNDQNGTTLSLPSSRQIRSLSIIRAAVSVISVRWLGILVSAVPSSSIDCCCRWSRMVVDCAWLVRMVVGGRLVGAVARGVAGASLAGCAADYLTVGPGTSVAARAAAGGVCG